MKNRISHELIYLIPLFVIVDRNLILNSFMNFFSIVFVCSRFELKI